MLQKSLINKIILLPLVFILLPLIFSCSPQADDDVFSKQSFKEIIPVRENARQKMVR